MKANFFTRIFLLFFTMMCLFFCTSLMANQQELDKLCKKACAQIYTVGSDEYHACVYCCTHDCE